MQGHFFCLGSHKVVDDVTEGEIAKKLENTTRLTLPKESPLMVMLLGIQVK